MLVLAKNQLPELFGESLTKSFKNAKLLAANHIGVAEPQPDDCLLSRKQRGGWQASNNQLVGGFLCCP